MTKWDRISIAFIAMVAAGEALPRADEIVSVFDFVAASMGFLAFVTLTVRLVYVSWQSDEREG